MSLKRGDVIKVLDHGVIPPGAHPIVILCIQGDTVLLSNITDIENEDFIPCILEPADDPHIIKIRSTFRYYSIREKSVKAIETAIQNNAFKECGQLSITAFNKIIAGRQSPDAQIKPKFKAILNPAPLAVPAPRPRPPAPA